MAVESGSPVLAKYPGRCGACDREFVVDEDLIVMVDGEWCHDECIEEEAGEA